MLLSFVAYAATGLVAAVTFHVLRQLFFFTKNEPPVVFHWFPLLGSTVSFGMDPLKFFADCKKKVSYLFIVCCGEESLTQSSMATSSPSSSSAKRQPSIWESMATSSFSTASSKMSMQKRSTAQSPLLSSAPMLSTIAQTRSSWSKRRSVSVRCATLTPAT
ncbi:Cytochrome P450 E-class group IV [Macrophomina phaseolina MS6]|uniref:Cytochrome P450 E-class group IV n=1 Tax=Macrophomina phaseolina (strain MS6) TaxID=1126212 RepID=K2SW71_MACPH|nr:Cytochrome P450 E-class group IV [Macrophomina phaseolina MS6]